MPENMYAIRSDMDHYRIVLVTGPQRSGTTFVAKAISHDTRRPYVDEAAFGTGNYRLFVEITEKASTCVLQAPSMMKFVHAVPDDVLVVVVRRKTEDIRASQERIGWSGESLELGRYQKSGIIADVKYAYWDKNKVHSPAHWVEIEYESMSNHPLWVERDDRKNFTSKQTEI